MIAPHEEYVRWLEALQAVPPIVDGKPGDYRRWCSEVAAIPQPPAIWWFDERTAEFVRNRDGARFFVMDVPPACRPGPTDVEALDRWIDEQLELDESQVRARALSPFRRSR